MRIVKDGTDLDLDPNWRIAYTLTNDLLEAADNGLEDPTQVNLSNSSEVKIPLTRHNRGLLGNLQAQDATGNEYNAPLVDVYDFRGAQIASNARLLLKKVEGRNAIANLVDGGQTFFQQLEGLTLQCLGVGNLGTAVERTEANIVANINNSHTSGFTYATFNNGNYSGGAYAIDQLYPFPFVWQVLKAISDLTDFTILESFGLMSDAEFRKLVIPFSGERYNPSAQFYDDARGFSVTGGSLPSGTYQPIGSNIGGGGQIVLDNDNFVPATGFVIPDGNKAYFFEGRLDQDITTNSGSYEFNLRIRNRTQNTTLASYSSGAIGGAGATVADSRTLQTGLLSSFNTGDVVTFEIDAVTGLDFQAKNPTYFRNCDGRYSNATIYATNLYQNPPVGFVFDPVVLLPSLSCIEFVKAILNMHCTKFGADGLTKLFNLNRFKDYSTNINNNWDISDKVNGLFPIKKENTLKGYVQINLFLYDNEDDIDKLFGSGRIEIGNDSIDVLEKTLVKLPFSASTEGVNGLIIPIADSGSDDIVNELKPRIAYTQDITGGSITIGSTGVANYNRCSFREIAWEATSGTTPANVETIGLLVDYWTEFRKLLQAIEKVTLQITMEAKDFEELDFFAIIKINYSDSFQVLNGYYILQKVDEYDGNGLAKIEMVRVNFE